MNDAVRILLSAVSAAGISLAFRVRKRDLWLAALCGGFTRAVLIGLTAAGLPRLATVILAAGLASLLGQILSQVRRVPPNYFIYPAILPMLPGGQLYQTMAALTARDTAGFLHSGSQTLVTVLGMSIGFVLSSTAVYYAETLRRRATQEGEENA